jgi:hypothetical protein
VDAWDERHKGYNGRETPPDLIECRFGECFAGLGKLIELPPMIFGRCLLVPTFMEDRSYNLVDEKYRMHDG